jgi:small-conductance mechanosensitive channel
MGVGLAAVRWIRTHWTAAAASERDESPPLGRARTWLDHAAAGAGALLGFAAGADVLGYTQVAALVGNGVVVAARAALAAWVLMSVLEGLVTLVLRTWPWRALRLVRRNPARAARRVRMLVRWALATIWVVFTLRGFRVWAVLAEWGAGILAARLEVGEVQVSLGNVLVFALGVALAVMLSRVVHVVLEEEVLSRVQLPRGIPYAISTFAGYAVLGLGLVTAVGAAGADLSRVSLVLGALGVGVGFGLQEIVKDFVAGAVLLFERPIQPGDVVQMGELSGDVRRIGLRSSTVHTFEGAEVIVPNSALTSSQIVNWTLSDRLRRVDVTVGVAYGTDPHRVIALLEEVARRQPDILEEPPPRALFMGFGDSSLDFQVRAWTNQVDQMALLRSGLALGVHDALVEAGITIPFPQRDVHLVPAPPAREPDPA